LRGVLGTSICRCRAAQVLVLGEAGVGKSRLAEEVAEIAVSEHGADMLEARCVPYGEANVWWPLAEAVRQACGLSISDTGEAAEQKLRVSLAARLDTDLDSPEVVRAADGLAFLLG